MNSKELVKHVQAAIDNGEKEISKLPNALLSPKLYGLSSNKVRHFFNNLCTITGWRHLEIGASTGSTLLAAGYLNPLDCIIAIDDFSMRPDNKPVLEANLKAWKDCLPQVSLIESDCWDVNKKTLGKFTIYFYDAFHAMEAQKRAIVDYWECLKDVAVIIVDDYDAKKVNRGTMQGFKALNVENKIVKKWHLKGSSDFVIRQQIWWGGLGIFVIDKRR